MAEKMLTVEEIAERLSVSKGFIYHAVTHTTIPHIRLGSSIRFDSQQIDEWIKENSVSVASMREMGEEL
jgi:excisionase family DNA binding protein